METEEKDWQGAGCSSDTLAVCRGAGQKVERITAPDSTLCLPGMEVEEGFHVLDLQGFVQRAQSAGMRASMPWSETPNSNDADPASSTANVALLGTAPVQDP